MCANSIRSTAERAKRSAEYSRNFSRPSVTRPNPIDENGGELRAGVIRPVASLSTCAPTRLCQLPVA